MYQRGWYQVIAKVKKGDWKKFMQRHISIGQEKYMVSFPRPIFDTIDLRSSETHLHLLLVIVKLHVIKCIPQCIQYTQEY